MKLTTQAIRKILNEMGMPQKGQKYKQLVNRNGICYGYVSVTTGMVVRNFVKGKSIQVWAHTSSPVQDIHKVTEELKAVGYDVREEGFQCIVSLPEEVE